MDNNKDSDITKGDDDNMIANAVRFDVSDFNEFLKSNMDKINSIAESDPVIAKDDIWRSEDFWDDLSKEKKNK